MKTRTLLAAVLASAFALPLAATAGGNKDHAAKTASSGTATTATNDVGTQATFKSMDKDGDGYISKAESAGSSNDAQFTQFDKNSDGRLTSAEYANGSANLDARSQTQGSATSPGMGNGTSPSTSGTTSPGTSNITSGAKVN